MIEPLTNETIVFLAIIGLVALAMLMAVLLEYILSKYK